MNNTIMLKKNYEFKRLFSKGKFIYGDNIHIYFIVTRKDYNKFGIAVSKKNGKAVIRNHIKRLIREVYKQFENNVNLGVDILVITNNKKETKEISFYDIKKDMEKALKKAGIWVDKC